jgi:peptide/nickel transport system substrate-binding protein
MGWSRRAWIAVAVVGATAAGCGGSYDDSSGKSADGTKAAGATGNSVLAVNMAVAPGTLDPASGCGMNDLAIAGNLYSRLVRYGSKPGPEGTTQMDPSKYEPEAADSWEISPDGKTYTFKLKPDMKFPSGEPLDAAAVKYSFERVGTMNGCGTFFLYDGILAPPLIKAIETPDPQTVVLKLSVPDANMLQALAQPAAGIVDKSVVEANGGVKKNTVNQWMSSHSAGAGPFVLQSYEPNKSAVLEANPDYAGTAPASKRLTINFINSDPTLLLQAKSGDADVTIGLAKQSAKSLEGNADVKLVVNETPTSEQIGLPNTKPPFDNRTFREALAHAMPYEEIRDKVAFGYAKLFYGPMQPVFADFDAELSAPLSYDIEKAKQLVAKSGVKTPVDVEMVVQEGNTAEQQIATIAQGEWRKLGVNVKVRKLPASDYITGLESHKYQSYVRIDGPGVIDPGYYLGYDMTCKFSANLSEVCLPEAEKLVKQARRESDAAKRKALYDRVTQIWRDDFPKIHVYADEHVAVLSTRVKSYFYSHEIDMRTWGK